MRVYFDESGNTGQDLLNSAQPYFVLASNNFSTDQLKELISLFEINTEIRFSKMRKYGKHQIALISFLNHPLISENNIQIFIANKELVTVCQIVDMLIEPVCFHSGINLYEKGENIAISNFIYAFGNHFWDKILYDSMLHDFVRMVREPTQKNKSQFYTRVKALLESPKVREKSLIAPILQSEKYIDNIISEDKITPFRIDISLSALLTVCDIWYHNCQKELKVFHDESKQINYFKSIIKNLSDLNISDRYIGYGERTLKFPLPIQFLKTVDSNDFLGVQISDLIASSIAFSLNNINSQHEQFIKNVKMSRLYNLNNNFVILPLGEDEIEKFGS